jgi:pimeloyl-ACP methyl ester carboxylesterase
VASAADDVRWIVDALGVGRFAVMGASSGGSHALACAALLGDRVTGAVGLGAVAPFTTSYDWFGGMVAPGALRAAQSGRAERLRYAATATFDESSFIDLDWAALESTWSSLGDDAQRAGADGPDGQVDDDVALVSPWGCDVAAITAPVLIAHGGEDRVIPSSHGDWLVQACPTAELWLRPRDGHISILNMTPVALDWLLFHAAS